MARDLALNVYRASKSFPPEEVCGMRKQLRDAVISITANIAEGFGRYHYKENLNFLYDARGSLAETESFIMLAHDLEYLDEPTCQPLRELCQQELRVLNGYIKAVRAKMQAGEVHPGDSTTK